MMKRMYRKYERIVAAIVWVCAKVGIMPSVYVRKASIAMERQEMFVSRVNRVNFRTKQARRTASRAPINRAVETAGG